MSLDVDCVVRRGGFQLEACFRAPSDRISALFGPSGAGKTMLLSAISGVIPLASGRVAFKGRVLEEGKTRLPAHDRGVGHVFQDARLFPHLSVAANLDYAEKRAGSGALFMARDEAVAAFEIGALLPRAVRSLSGGERSRVALARAALARPDLLLLDEPFAALDGPRRRVMAQALLDAHRRTGIPIVLVTHLIEDAARMASHLIVLDQGRTREAGAFATVAAAAVTQKLLHAIDIGAALPAAFLDAAAPKAPEAHWVRADAVLLANHRPQGLSARNIFAATVDSITREAERRVLVRLQCEGGALFARITTEALDELAIAPGGAVWAIVKASAV